MTPTRAFLLAALAMYAARMALFLTMEPYGLSSSKVLAMNAIHVFDIGLTAALCLALLSAIVRWSRRSKAKA